jgi:hypothetical protein
MLLYAQPLTRILRLTLDDVMQEDGQVAIRLGDPPAPVPEPFASLLLRHMGQRLNLATATNAGARFPGRRGGQPMTPDALERRLKLAGIPTRGGRSAALRQLVLQAPAPVIATMLRLQPRRDRPGRSTGRQPVEPLRTRRPRPTAIQGRKLMTASSLPAALRAGAAGLYALEAATGLIIAHGTWLARDDDFGRFIHHGAGTAAIDWEAAVDALRAGRLPRSAGGTQDALPRRQPRRPGTRQPGRGRHRHRRPQR